MKQLAYSFMKNSSSTCKHQTLRIVIKLQGKKEKKIARFRKGDNVLEKLKNNALGEKKIKWPKSNSLKSFSIALSFLTKGKKCQL